MSKKKRDQFWIAFPRSVECYAALNNRGGLMINSVRETREAVRLACGECVPVKVQIVCIDYEDD